MSPPCCHPLHGSEPFPLEQEVRAQALSSKSLLRAAPSSSCSARPASGSSHTQLFPKQSHICSAGFFLKKLDTEGEEGGTKREKRGTKTLMSSGQGKLTTFLCVKTKPLHLKADFKYTSVSNLPLPLPCTSEQLLGRL